MDESYLIKKDSSDYIFFLRWSTRNKQSPHASFSFSVIFFVEGEFVQMLFAQNWNDTNSKAILINF